MSTGTQDERFTRPATSSPDLVVEGGVGEINLDVD